MKLGRSVAERLYALYREQFNPDLIVPELRVVDWTFAERADADHQN